MFINFRYSAGLKKNEYEKKTGHTHQHEIQTQVQAKRKTTLKRLFDTVCAVRVNPSTLSY